MTNMVLAHMANMVLAATFERKVFPGRVSELHSITLSLPKLIVVLNDEGENVDDPEVNMIWTVMMLSAIFAGTFEFGLQRIVPKCGASSYKSTTFTAENKHSRKHRKSNKVYQIKILQQRSKKNPKEKDVLVLVLKLNTLVL